MNFETVMQAVFCLGLVLLVYAYLNGGKKDD